jgi:hypothetical protein
MVKIINCDLGDETEFVENDLILHKIEDREENTYQNILSPARSKGLEFPQVILYRFGESAPNGFEKLLNGELDIHDDIEKCLQYEYFLNRLYVAASRAKKQLIIVDSREAIERFWKFATDPVVLNTIAKRLRDFSTWQDKVAYLLPGGYEAWTGEPVDIRAQANEYEIQGRNSRDPYLLRQAALSFRSVGEQIKSIKCFAMALELENRYQEAGDIYKQSGLYNEAFDSYWRGKNFSSIQQLTTEYSSLSSQIKSRAADFMSQTSAIPGGLISELFGMFSSGGDMSHIFDDLTWHSVLLEISERSQRMLQDKEHNWGNIATVLETCYAKGINFDERILGQIAYRANRFKEAVRHFERSDNSELREYYEAQAELNTFPRNLLWLNKLNSFARIRQEWKEHPEFENAVDTLDKEVAMVVCDAAVETQDYQLASRILQYHCDLNRARKVFDGAIAKHNYSIALAVIQNSYEQSRAEKLFQESLKKRKEDIAASTAILLLQSLIKNKRWQDALNLVNGHYELSTTDNHQLCEEFLRQQPISRLLTQKAVVMLSQSVELAKESPDSQAPVSEFLFQRFIRQKPFLSVRNAGLSLKVVGAAIERAGRIINAIRFYDTLQGYRRLPDEEMRFVQERLILNLERYAGYLRSDKQSNRAEDQELQAKALRSKIGIGSRHLPDYPEITENDLAIKQNLLSDVDSGSEPPTQRSEWEHDILSCRCSSDRDKWRVEHKELFETVTFSLSDLDMKGDASFSRMTTAPNTDVVAWRIETWNTTVRILKRDANLEILIECGTAKPLRISP